MSELFSPLTLRSLTFKNRIAVSPMCEYSSVDGMPNEWHLVHLGSRAVGGAGLVLTEATAVEADGRISPADTGIYNDEQMRAWAPIVAFIEREGSVPGIQLAHAGRKAGAPAPWQGERSGIQHWEWSPIWGPSAIPFHGGYQTPTALDESGIQRVVEAFATAAERSLEAGFKVAEIHGAHGYLIHEFLSPISNLREDRYGGSLENRMRMPLEVVAAVRGVWPDPLPVTLRISASDWAPEGGWDIEQSVELSRRAKELGVDLIDCSSGETLYTADIPLGPGYQVPFAEQIRRDAGIATGAVGMITEPEQAEEIIASGKADMVLLARELLRDPYWPRRAAKALGAGSASESVRPGLVRGAFRLLGRPDALLGPASR